MTTSLVLTDEQFQILNEIALDRLKKGKTKKFSLSAVMRGLIDDNIEAFRRELEEQA